MSTRPHHAPLAAEIPAAKAALPGALPGTHRERMLASSGRARFDSTAGTTIQVRLGLVRVWVRLRVKGRALPLPLTLTLTLTLTLNPNTNPNANPNNPNTNPNTNTDRCELQP